MGATQLWQAHMMPPSPGMDPGQQKIMKFMPLMFIALFYRMSAGLTLYWTVQNLLSILQTKVTKMTEPAARRAGPRRREEKEVAVPAAIGLGSTATSQYRELCQRNPKPYLSNS